jgi:hypothetical protein
MHKYRYYSRLLLRGLSTINASGWLTIQVSFKDQVIQFLSRSGIPYLSFDDDQRKSSSTLETRAAFLVQEFSSSIPCKCTTVTSNTRKCNWSTGVSTAVSNGPVGQYKR